MAIVPREKKTMRHFQCVEALWNLFEQMASDFDCSVDYLINEAMRGYARSKRPAQAQLRQDVGPPALPTWDPIQRKPARTGTPRPSDRTEMSSPRATTPRPVVKYGIQPPSPSPRPLAPKYGIQEPSPGPRPASTSGTMLVLVFNEQRIPIQKDPFVIGRATRSSDLAIKDGNISRKHAAIIRRHGAYHLADLGSTNGVSYQGLRIDSKPIDEGDVFFICDYQLRFTYQ